MVTTKHCCYGKCRSDSRYSDRDYMKNVRFLRFPKPHVDLEKCKKWVHACGRRDFTVENIKKDTYICTIHFVGENGPSNEHPDPVPATFNEEQIHRFSRKRKPPMPRDVCPSPKKQQQMDAASGLLMLSVNTMTDTQSEVICDRTSTLSASQPVLCVSSTNKENKKIETFDKGTQVDFKSREIDLLVRLKSENAILKNELTLLKNADSSSPTSGDLHLFSVNDVENNEEICKFYTGLTWIQFMSLWNFLGPARDKLLFWKRDFVDKEATSNERCGPDCKLTPMNELF